MTMSKGSVRGLEDRVGLLAAPGSVAKWYGLREVGEDPSAPKRRIARVAGRTGRQTGCASSRPARTRAPLPRPQRGDRAGRVGDLIARGQTDGCRHPPEREACLPGCRNCPLGFLREPDGDEVQFRVQIVLPGFVHHSDVPVASGPFVGQDLVDLPELRIAAFAVLDINGVLEAVVLSLRALFAGRSAMTLDNLALRQQLVVLRRAAKRPRLRPRDRAFWVWLAKEPYHTSRPRLSLGRNAPEPQAIEPRSKGEVVAIPMVGGLHHRCTRAA